MAKTWKGSAAERAWRNGYRPLDQGVWLPPDAFHSGGDKVAFMSGHLDLATRLPAPAPDGQRTAVRWPDGSKVALPLLSARQVFDGLVRGEAGCEGPDCDRRLRVTGAKAATHTLMTSRGRATVPVWEFTIEGYAQPFVYAAVASGKPPEGSQADRPAPEIKGLAAGVSWNGISSDGLVLKTRVAHGTCVDVLPGRVYETGNAVVLVGRVGPWKVPGGGACDAALRMTPAQFRLSHPLGDRTVLDATTGDPLALQALDR
ncbi:hypothetical protein ABZ721_36235 [Streptomyces sp. NPDC006733]|uniref:hypothetical protein n=1 Tax=Streptomyces sp. NPDC006733 TaxID=3155460 RepID=UPI0034002892